MDVWINGLTLHQQCTLDRPFPKTKHLTRRNHDAELLSTRSNYRVSFKDYLEIGLTNVKRGQQQASSYRNNSMHRPCLRNWQTSKDNSSFYPTFVRAIVLQLQQNFKLMTFCPRWMLSQRSSVVTQCFDRHYKSTANYRAWSALFTQPIVRMLSL